MTQRIRVVAIDDNPAIRWVLNTYMLAKGIEMITAGTVKEFEARCLEARPHAVLVDLGLGEHEKKTGEDLIREILGKPNGPVPIILSGKSRAKLDEKSAELGVPSIKKAVYVKLGNTKEAPVEINEKEIDALAEAIRNAVFPDEADEATEEEPTGSTATESQGSLSLSERVQALQDQVSDLMDSWGYRG